MKKITLLLIIAIPLIVTACGGDQADTAVQYLEALNDRDLETARSLVCEARQDDITMGLTTVDETEAEAFVFTSIACSPRGDDVHCRFTIDQDTENVEETGVTQTREVVFDIENDKICGFQEEVAQ